MKKCAIAVTVLVLGFLFIVTGMFFVMRSRLQTGLLSIAASIGESSPEAAYAYFDSLIGAPADAERAKEGIRILDEAGYSTIPVRLYTHGIFPDSILYAFAGAALAVFAVAAWFLLFERYKSRKYQQQLVSRIGSALRGESRFTASSDDELELARLFKEIERLNALRESSAEELRLYVENVAHEIKTPTAGILLNLDLIESGASVETHVSAARSCTARIGFYVDSLLSLARIKAGKMHMNFETSDLEELVDETASELTTNGISAEITGKGAVINCDRNRVGEALRNLIVNASKHQNGKPVKIELSSDEDSARIRVCDDGPGIKAASLIERYSVGSEDGTSHGIGLSYAKEVAERHSGKLVICTPEKGSAVELVFPIFKLKTSIPV